MINCGDIVYTHDTSGNIYKLVITGISGATDKPMQYQTYYQTTAIDFDEYAIGKQIFLTREEAEKHAKGGDLCN